MNDEYNLLYIVVTSNDYHSTIKSTDVTKTLLCCNYQLEVWNDTTRETKISHYYGPYFHHHTIPLDRTARGDSGHGALNVVQVNAKRPPAVHVCRAPAADRPGRGRARAEKTSTAAGGFRISARTARQRRRENDDDSRIRR